MSALGGKLPFELRAGRLSLASMKRHRSYRLLAKILHTFRKMDRGTFRIRTCALPGIKAIESESSHVFSKHTHDAYGVGRMLRGGQRSWSGRGVVEARRGDMISSNPGEVHDGAPLGSSRTWKMLFISPALVARTILDIEEDRTSEFEFEHPVFGPSPSVVSLERCYAAMTSATVYPLAAETELIRLLSGLLVRARRRYTPPALEMRRAKQRIDQNPAEPLSLQELAAESGLSRFQALRGFTRLTGLPPHAYQVQRRVELARGMISRGASVSDAAIAAGFADQSHLHRTFVRRFGMTPGAYAAALR